MAEPSILKTKKEEELYDKTYKGIEPWAESHLRMMTFTDPQKIYLAVAIHDIHTVELSESTEWNLLILTGSLKILLRGHNLHRIVEGLAMCRIKHIEVCQYDKETDGKERTVVTEMLVSNPSFDESEE